MTERPRPTEPRARFIADFVHFCTVCGVDRQPLSPDALWWLRRLAVEAEALDALPVVENA